MDVGNGVIQKMVRAGEQFRSRFNSGTVIVVSVTDTHVTYRYESDDAVFERTIDNFVRRFEPA